MEVTVSDTSNGETVLKLLYEKKTTWINIEARCFKYKQIPVCIELYIDWEGKNELSYRSLR
jgi:hypothetical protein